MNKTKRSISFTEIIKILFLIIMAILLLFPFWSTIVHSLEPKGFLPIPSKWYLLPVSFNFINYKLAWQYANLLNGFLVSVFYVTIFTFVSGMVAMLVGYVIAKKRFRGRKFIYFMLLSTMMVPGEVLLIPNYLLVRDLHMLDNLAALIVPGLVNIMGVFIAKQFMESVPDSVLEAARIDGAGEWRTFLRIAFPMAKSAFATYVIITFTATWNDYLWPMLVLNNYKIYPVQLAIQSFVSSNMGNNDYGNILKDAALISTLIPVLAIYFTFQKRFADGFAISGLK